jgi:hypothetical protein
MQHYVIKFVSDLRQVSGFQQVAVSSINKTDRHDALYSWNIVESGITHHVV